MCFLSEHWSRCIRGTYTHTTCILVIKYNRYLKKKKKTNYYAVPFVCNQWAIATRAPLGPIDITKSQNKINGECAVYDASRPVWPRGRENTPTWRQRRRVDFSHSYSKLYFLMRGNTLIQKIKCIPSQKLKFISPRQMSYAYICTLHHNEDAFWLVGAICWEGW